MFRCAAFVALSARPLASAPRYLAVVFLCFESSAHARPVLLPQVGQRPRDQDPARTLPALGHPLRLARVHDMRGSVRGIGAADAGGDDGDRGGRPAAVVVVVVVRATSAESRGAERGGLDRASLRRAGYERRAASDGPARGRGVRRGHRRAADGARGGSQSVAAAVQSTQRARGRVWAARLVIRQRGLPVRRHDGEPD